MFTSVGSRSGRGRLFRGNLQSANFGNLNAAGQIANQYGGFTLIHQAIEIQPAGKTKTTFIYTGSNQTWVVPAGVTYIYAKVWGAGGGPGTIGGWSWSGHGGGGGHSFGLIPVVPNETLYIVVGQGGLSNYTGSTTPLYGGGGGFTNNSDNQYAGSGGGYTGIFRSSVAQANALLIAGGGGGGTSMYNGNYRGLTDWANGGAGGGLVGAQGHTVGNANCNTGDANYKVGGLGGSQSAGGTKGNGSSQGSDGSALTGGYGASAAGGGGGGGYYGGGGGGYYGAGSVMGGGGGGSGYVGSTVLFGGTYCGAGKFPGFYDDPDLPQTVDATNGFYHGWGAIASYNAGSAGSTWFRGGCGYTVIYY